MGINTRKSYSGKCHTCRIRGERKSSVYCPGKEGRHMDLRKMQSKLRRSLHPLRGQGIHRQDYDVLVYPINAVGFLDWKHASGGNVPDNAFKTDKDLYVGRAYHAGSLIPGKISTRYKVAYIGYGLKEHTTKEYEVLCQIK